MDGLRAEPHAQAFAQLLPGDGAGRALVEQVTSEGLEGLQVAGPQSQCLHRLIESAGFEAAAQQLEQQGRVTLGRQQVEADGRGGPMGVFQFEAQPRHPAAAAVEEGDEILDHAPQRKGERLMIVDDAGQLQPHVVVGGGPKEVQYRRTQAAQLVEVGQQHGPEAAAQAIGRQGQQLLQPLDAQPVQALAGVIGQSGPADGHTRQRRLQLAVVDDVQTILPPGQHPGGTRIRGQRDAVPEVQGIQFAAQPRLQCRPAPHQPQAVADLQHQGAGPAGMHLAAEAAGPVGQPVLPALLVGRVMDDGLKILTDGAGEGEALAGAQPLLPGRRIDGQQALAVGRPVQQGQGLAGVVAPAQHDVEWQPGQGDAGPEHGFQPASTAGAGHRSGTGVAGRTGESPSAAGSPKGRAGTLPPRHLSTLSRPPACSCSRKAAGEGWRAWRRWRSRKPGVWPWSAATCRRRSMVWSAPSGQPSTAAQQAERRHCSRLQKVSAPWPAVTMLSCRRSTPARCQLIA